MTGPKIEQEDCRHRFGARGMTDIETIGDLADALNTLCNKVDAGLQNISKDLHNSPARPEWGIAGEANELWNLISKAREKAGEIKRKQETFGKNHFTLRFSREDKKEKQ